MTNEIWKQCLLDISTKGEVSKPRSMVVKELLSYSYKIKMSDPIISLKSRKMNYGFMFGEAGWITSGSNWLEDLLPFMKRYADFSDDKIFLNGAYGIKVVEQASYVANKLSTDNDSRQAVINIWRERPGNSKDIPCTLNLQFFIRNSKLHAVVNMRSQDVVLGMSYDIFSFSSIALLINLMLAKNAIFLELGDLHVHVGSFHLYETHFDKLNEWLDDESFDKNYEFAIEDWCMIKDTRYEPKDLSTELYRCGYDYLRRS
jgi:thymidylate synthase